MEDRLSVIEDDLVRGLVALMAAHATPRPTPELINALRRKVRAGLRTARLIGRLHGNDGALAQTPQEEFELSDTCPGFPMRLRRPR